ncbi:MAG: 5-formyltetrahydrofolate cyclo-ligase [Burkholderiales bacterium]|nr:5-formyltetrahydrofolate cyclo-ligase [Burkholderiales bacterium]
MQHPEAIPESGQLAPEDLGKWRREMRKAFRARRVALKGADRDEANARVTHHLLDAFGLLQGMTVGFYEPMHGEVDPWPAVKHLRHQGTIAALPVVVQRRAPLAFREWRPDVRMVIGPFGLREPADSASVIPRALLIPPVAFDGRGYRLGYGSGYFDRTLAAMHPQPLKIALAFELSRIDTIHPQAHDIPMDFIVTEAAIYLVRESGIEMTRDCAHAAQLAHEALRERIAGVGKPSPAILEALQDTTRQYASPPCLAREFDPYYWDD